MSNITYIDLGEGYFEVTPFSIGEFQKQLVGGEMFLRYSWPEIIFKNEPKKYRETLLDRYRLYDLIVARKYNQEIKIKHRWQFGVDWLEIEGIFWSSMCKCEDDEEHKTIKITPIVLDQYTYALNNWDKEIDVLTGGNKNKCVNGDFISWVDNLVPIGWNRYGLLMERYYKFDRIFAKMNCSDDNQSFLYQSINVTEGENIELSFEYENIYYGDVLPEIRVRRTIAITLESGGVTYYLRKVGNNYSWGIDVAGIEYTQSTQIALEANYFTGLKKFSLVSDAVPVSGILTMYFLTYNLNVSQRVIVYMILGGVRLYVNNTLYEDITINISADGLESREINGTSNILIAKPKTGDYEEGQVGSHPLYGYFVDAAPNMERLADVGLGLRDDDLNDALLSDIATTIATDPYHAMYKAEISQLTVYEGEEYGLELYWWRPNIRILGTCSFTREVSYSLDVDNLPVSPPGNGWFNTGLYEPTRGRKWVRTPYNGEYTAWEHYGITDEITGTTVENGRIDGLNYTRKLMSRKTYPFADGSKTFDKGMDFYSLIKLLFNSLHPIYADKEVYSNFFWNNKEDELPTIFHGLNYVTRDVNFLNNLTCLHTRELKTTLTDDSSDNELKISFKGLMDDLKSYLKIYDIGGLYWWIDETYNLHIEHSKYIDLTTLCYNITNYINKPMRNWSSNSELLYANITFDQINSGYKDFHLNKMSFDTMNIKISPEKTRENKTKIFTTDLRYCIENPNGLTNGLILINHDGNGVAAYKQSSGINRRAPSSNQYPITELNGNLSLDNLLNLFGRYEGVWTIGYINEKEVGFEKILRIIEGDEVIAKAIVDGQYFSTPIEYGGMATVITHDFNDQTTRIKILYRSPFGIGEDNNLIDFGYYRDLIE